MLRVRNPAVLLCTGRIVVSKRIVDYYAVLNLPATADLDGIENAYMRLPRDLAGQISEDETATLAFERLNEAYGVLGHLEERRAYDQVYFIKEIADLQAEQTAARRRRKFTSGVMVGALGLIVLGQSAVLAYMGRDYLAVAADFVLGPLLPGTTG